MLLSLDMWLVMFWINVKALHIYKTSDLMAVLLYLYCTCSALVHVCQSAAVGKWTEIFSSYTSSAKTKVIQLLLNFKLCSPPPPPPPTSSSQWSFHVYFRSELKVASPQSATAIKCYLHMSCTYGGLNRGPHMYTTTGLGQDKCFCSAHW